ncbi:hypothetical protein H6G96_09800 [Nostoc sp. FACHB-892]|uniref:hypothetical protein n=1 Tax=Nostoc sp. FACHB-892 TaxID=2692843 RepID=UPI001686CF9A|nr:hypothetical protein [Nostoc sp. FACHB-892]MBD2726614.1 hypothetical protein [Nostoc sp. FACHB-892]
MFKKHLTKNYSTNDPFIQHFFASISPQIAASFTHAQLAELKNVFGNRVGKRHTVNIRLSIPFFKKSFYLVFLLGKEKRLKKR